MRLLLLSSLFISSTVLACPNLAGKYATCKTTSGEPTGTTDINVSQRLDRGVTIYSIESKNVNDSGEVTVSESFRADGKTVIATETDPDSGMTAELATTATCQGAKSLNLLMKLTINGEEIARVTTTVSKNGNSLMTVTKSVGAEGESVETVVCK